MESDGRPLRIEWFMLHSGYIRYFGKTIGLLASIGRRMGVARIFGFNFSGFFAWWLWRTVYLSKLPGLDKKIRVAFDWTLDLLFPKDVCAVYDLEHDGRNFRWPGRGSGGRCPTMWCGPRR